MTKPQNTGIDTLRRSKIARLIFYADQMIGRRNAQVG